MGLRCGGARELCSQLKRTTQEKLGRTMRVW